MYAPPATPMRRIASITWRYDSSFDTTFSDAKYPPGSESRRYVWPKVDSGATAGTAADGATPLATGSEPAAAEAAGAATGAGVGAAPTGATAAEWQPRDARSRTATAQGARRVVGLMESQAETARGAPPAR